MKVTDDRLLEELIDCKRLGRPSKMLMDFCHQLIIQVIEHDRLRHGIPIYNYTGEARERMLCHATWVLRNLWKHFNADVSKQPMSHIKCIIRSSFRSTIVKMKHA